MASTWTLSDIQSAIRRVTGRYSSADISNAELKKRINQYYTLIFPAEVKLEQKHVFYEFTTSVNQQSYDLPETTFTNFEPPATCNNFLLTWYQDPMRFKSDNFINYTFITPWTADGSTVAFTTNITPFPLMPGSITIYDGVELFEDTNTTWTTSDVSITGSLGGVATVNYSTGAISVNFSTAPISGAVINLNYIVFVASRPISILLYDNQFQVWPIPNQAYKIVMKAYSVVIPLENATDTPYLNEWGRCIVYGTARDLLADSGEMDGYAEVTALYREQISYVLKRTNQNLLNTRATPQF